MKPTGKAWQAAFLDSEGTISITKSHFKSEYRAHSRPSRRGFNWNIRVHITNTNLGLLGNSQKLSGGKIIPIKTPSKAQLNMKPQYVLFFRAEESEILLKTIMPYLIAKKRHAILYLEAREIMNLYNNMGQDLEVTDVRDKRLEAIYWELRILNMKGKNGAEHVLEEISRLPSDPRLYTREMMEQDVGVAWGVIGERKHDVRLRISREWKARNRDRMHAYWRDWSKRGKSEIPATPNYASA